MAATALKLQSIRDNPGESMTEFPLTLSYLYIFKKVAIAITESRSPFGRLIVPQFISNGSMSMQHPLRCFYD